MSDPDVPDAHAHIPKHVQLGVDLEQISDGDHPRHLDPDEDAGAIDALWADATTVEQYAADLKTIEETWPEEDIVALREARQQT